MTPASSGAGWSVKTPRTLAAMHSLRLDGIVHPAVRVGFSFVTPPFPSSSRKPRVPGRKPSQKGPLNSRIVTF